MSHPFDNMQFGPNVHVMDIKTGIVFSPFFERIFGVSAEDIKKREAADRAFEEGMHDAEVAAIAKTAAGGVRQRAMDAYAAIPRHERGLERNVVVARNYILARQQDADDIVSKMSATGGLSFVKVRMGEDEVSVILTSSREELTFFCMTLALAHILASWY